MNSPAPSSPHPPPQPSQAERDQQLAQLLSELSEERRRGRPADFDAIAARHPDLADELRELWGAVVLVDELAHGERERVSAPSAPSLGR